MAAEQIRSWLEVLHFNKERRFKVLYTDLSLVLLERVFIMKTLNVKKMGGAALQAGFTIIELVVVILLLGILTATALPRFLDVTDEAHVAVQRGVIAGLNTGAALFRAAWVANGQTALNISQFGAGTMDAATTGYPVGFTDDDVVITDSGDCVEVFEGLLQPGGRPTTASAVFNATPATLETNIEAVSANADFVITTSAVPAGTPLSAPACNFYYTGQFKSGTAAATATIPLIIYTVATGTTAFGTSITLNQG